MTQSCSRVFLRTIRYVAADVLRFASSMLRSHAQLAAENLFLRKQFSLYLERGASCDGPLASAQLIETARVVQRVVTFSEGPRGGLSGRDNAKSTTYSHANDPWPRQFIVVEPASLPI